MFRRNSWVRAISRKTIYSAVWLAALSIEAGATHPAPCHENAMIVFDASGSMGVRHAGRRKIDIAREAIADVLPNISQTRPTGLVTYSGGPASACMDVALRVSPTIGSSPQIVNELAGLRPAGPTPLTRAVRLAATTLRDRQASGIIVLVTDGHESCLGNVCALARQLASDPLKLRVHTIGFRLEGRNTSELTCLSNLTGGTYTRASGLDALRASLQSVLSCPRLAQSAPRVR
ncbi:MAG: VWA domain-containing protein [Pseudomonadota bacterium]